LAELSQELLYPFYEKVDGIIPAEVNAGPQAAKDGNATAAEWAYAFKKGLIKLDDAQLTQCLTDFFRLRKQWYSYTQPGFLAPSPKGEDLFRDGKAAMRQAGVWDADTLMKAAKDGGWEIGSWGNIPKVTDAVSPCNRKNTSTTTPPFYRIGGGSAVGIGASTMVPMATVKNSPEKFAMIKDFLQWLTAPAQQTRYCKRMGPPGCSRPNAPVSEIFADNPELGAVYRGFYEPMWYWPGSPYGDKAKAGDNWNGTWIGPITLDAAMDDGTTRIEQQVWAGTLTPENAAAQYLSLIERELPEALKANPTWNSDNW
jgi:hypothetical protein